MKYPLQLSLCLWAGMVGACVDARDTFEDYGNRVVDAAPEVEIDGGIVSTLPNIDGEFYFVARPDLSEKRLFHLRITLDMTPVTENTAVVDYTAYFLNWMTLEPVGEPVTDEMLAVAEDATFDLPLDGTVPAAANSVSGSNARMDGVLAAQIVSADFLCGTATGTAGGLNLAGTVWAAQRITGDTLPDPVWSCDDQP